MKSTLALLFSLLILCLPAQSATAQTVEVTDPWIREPPPGAAMLAAYMTIVNASGHAVTLEGVSSSDFRMVEIHQTTMEEGVARMKKVSVVEIGAGESVALEPGGYHLMLMHPMRMLLAGDTVELLLHLDNDKFIPVTAIVRKQ